MRNYLIFKIWQHKKPALWSAVAILAVLLWPSIPLGGFIEWMGFLYLWFPQNILYVFMALLTGIYVGVFVYNKTIATTCPVDANAKLGFFGSMGGILLGACPACIPVLAFVLPLSATLFLGFWSWVFMALGSVIILFSIYKMNGFKKM